MLNRIKPYLVIIFILWPVFSLIMYYSLSSDTIHAKYKIKVAKKMTVPVAEVNKYKNSRSNSHYNYWATYYYYLENSRHEGGGPITEWMYSNITAGKLDKIDIYVHKSLINGSWTAQDLEQTSNRNTLDNAFFGVVLGIAPAIFIYFIISFIPFGKDKLSLRKRWGS